MCGQLTAYNTYATLSYTNPLFLGFSCYLNVNKEIIDFTIRNVSGRFRKVYYTPGLLFWGVFYDNCGKITNSENIYMQGRIIMITPRKIKHMAEKMERENLEFRTFLKCSADEKN